MRDNVEKKRLSFENFEEFNEHQCTEINGGASSFQESIKKLYSLVIDVFKEEN